MWCYFGTVPIIMTGCIAHAWNGHISTSGLKSDVTIVFLDTDFLRRGNFGDSAIHKGYFAYYILHIAIPEFSSLCAIVLRVEKQSLNSSVSHNERPSVRSQPCTCADNRCHRLQCQLRLSLHAVLAVSNVGAARIGACDVLVGIGVDLDFWGDAWRAPKVGPCPVGWGMRRGVPSPADWGVLSSPSGVRSRAPAENRFWRILKATFLYLYDKIWGGDNLH